MSLAYLTITVIIITGCWLLIKDYKAKYISVALVIIISFTAYNMYFEQLFAKKYGGTQVISIKDGEQFVGVSWKNDMDFWIITHDPIANVCYYRENSRLSVLEGAIKIKNCNPI